MTAAFSVRIDPELLNDAKKAAAKAGVSFTAYVSGALRLRMNATPSLLDQPMRDLTLVRPTSDVPRATRRVVRQGSLPGGDVCAHPFRDSQNRCRVCGQKR